MRTVDADDFDSWVAQNRPRLQKTAFLICGDWYVADDLVQEALTKCYPRWSRIREGGDPYPYLRKVLLRLCVDHTRRPSRREVPGPVPDRGTLPDLSSDALLRALREVPPGQRMVLVLRYWEGLSIEDVASATRTSAGNVKSQSSRGVQALRDALAEPNDREDA